jgi:hypothetical protein
MTAEEFEAMLCDRGARISRALRKRPVSRRASRT